MGQYGRPPLATGQGKQMQCDAVKHGWQSLLCGAMDVTVTMTLCDCAIVCLGIPSSHHILIRLVLFAHDGR